MPCAPKLWRTRHSNELRRSLCSALKCNTVSSRHILPSTSKSRPFAIDLHQTRLHLKLFVIPFGLFLGLLHFVSANIYVTNIACSMAFLTCSVGIRRFFFTGKEFPSTRLAKNVTTRNGEYRFESVRQSLLTCRTNSRVIFCRGVFRFISCEIDRNQSLERERVDVS